MASVDSESKTDLPQHAIFLVIPLEQSRGEAREIGVSEEGLVGDRGLEPLTSPVWRKPCQSPNRRTYRSLWRQKLPGQAGNERGHRGP